MFQSNESVRNLTWWETLTPGTEATAVGPVAQRLLPSMMLGKRGLNTADHKMILSPEESAHGVHVWVTTVPGDHIRGLPFPWLFYALAHFKAGFVLGEKDCTCYPAG